VHNIREKLKAAGGDPAVLVTVRGTGYRLAP
jgi:DNA-binding response OmpR family regulator